MFKSTFSVHDWFPEIFDYAFEFPYIINKYGINLITSFDYKTAAKLLSNERLFARYPVIEAYTQSIEGIDQYMTDYLFFKSPELFKKLIEHTMLVGVMGGFSIKLSYQNILSGFNSNFTHKWKNGNPSLGFNPAYPGKINLIPQGESYNLEKYTGVDDYSLVGKLKKINNLASASRDQSYFDGNDTDTILVNPWKNEVNINELGTFSNPFVPYFDESKK